MFCSRIPMMRVEGPLIVVQLMETTLLTLVNYARYRSNFLRIYEVSRMKRCQNLKI